MACLRPAHAGACAASTKPDVPHAHRPERPLIYAETPTQAANGHTGVFMPYGHINHLQTEVAGSRVCPKKTATVPSQECPH